jgi:hypothetical protein
MTLQYNVRSMSEDREWLERIRLSNCLLLETVDWWCRTDSDFPIDGTVASVLYLFSSRCNPFKVPDTRVREHLHNTVGTPTSEYSQTWSRRTDAEKSELIDTLSGILTEAVKRWNGGPLDDLPIELVNQQIIDQIVAHKYIIFHHFQTTRRDFGGFFGSY